MSAATRVHRRPTSAGAAKGPGSRGGASGLVPALRLTVRRCRFQVLAWVLPLWGLVMAVPSYVSVYPTIQLRGALVEGMRNNPGTRLLYGRLPLPGTIGQLAQWEIGSYLLVCTGLMTVLLTCRLLRADEDDGLVEAVRAAGVGRRVPFAAPVAVVLTVVTLLAAGVGGILHILTLTVAELTVGGAWAAAGTLAATGWAFTALTAAACQLARDGSAARALALMTLGASFGLRVTADETTASWLRWLTPLGWRDIIRPYSENRAWPLLVCTGVSLAVLAGATALERHREYLGGYLPDLSATRRRWRVRSHAGLLARLTIRSTATWTVSVAALSALFGTMSGTITDLLAPGSRTAAYVGMMTAGDPVVQFMSLLTVFTVLMVSIAVVQRVTGLVADERAGLTEVEAAAGVSRTRLLLTRACAALIEGAGLLAVSGAVLAAFTAAQVTQDRAVERALVFTVTQLPGVATTVGLALALVGGAPRRVPLVWAVVAWSAFAQFLGGLVELPGWAIDLSVIGHHLDVTGPANWKPLAVQAAVGAAGAVIGLVAHRRRDLVAW